MKLNAVCAAASGPEESDPMQQPAAMGQRIDDIPRGQWVRALAACAGAEVTALAERVASTYEIAHKRVPQAGLGLLQMRDGAFAEPYYLGEIPVSAAHVQLTDRSGSRFEGAAQVMADDADLAGAMAVCDAVLAHRLSGWEQVAALVEEGARRCNDETRQRAVLLQRTEVDFSELSQLENDDEY
jgi:alpha-D-ribose 1-methylphosphonate 5-triphosphate synthase subunit PhnG